jgi:hypothetical protein
MRLLGACLSPVLKLNSYAGQKRGRPDRGPSYVVAYDEGAIGGPNDSDLRRAQRSSKECVSLYSHNVRSVRQPGLVCRENRDLGREYLSYSTLANGHRCFQ